IVAPDASDVTVYDTPARVVRFGPRSSFPANGSKAPLTISPLAAWRAKEAVEAFDPDVVHFHEPFAPLLGWSLLRHHSRPALGTFHRSGNGPALRLTRPLLERLATRLDGAVSVSKSAARTIEDACGLKSDVLFNGFEMERFVATPRQRSSETVLFYVGRLEQRKSVATAVEAAHHHNARSERPWLLVIAGDGPERARLQALAARSQRIVFIGPISDEEKRLWLRRANALIAPSTRGESFGLVLLEGMASETLVVASDIEGYRSAGGEFATIFTPGNVSSLEGAIIRALEGESKKGIAAARQHAARWSMNALMDEYEERYERAQKRFQATK
ncbi:MAG TPA: glycosyltransferase family 4 protein, partial [Acidimicrobiales bacterium]|nr:glycosyltransferase family 4 protein [Acidimicrobiales bacterium]